MKRIIKHLTLTVLVAKSFTFLNVQAQPLNDYKFVVQIGHSTDIRPFKLTHDKKVCVTAAGENIVKIWDVEKCKLIRTLNEPKGGIIDVAISDDKKYIATVSDFPLNCLKLWDAITGDSIYALRTKGNQDYRRVAISPDCKYIYAANGYGVASFYVEIIDLKTGKSIKQLKGHSNDITTVNCSADGRYIVSGDSDHKVILWDAKTLSKVKAHKVKSEIYNVGVSGDGSLVFCNSDQAMDIFSVTTGKKIAEYSTCSTSGDVSPDNKLALTNKTVWDIATGQKISGYSGWDNRSSFGPGGKTIFSASGSDVALSETFSGKELKSSRLVPKPITGGAFFTADMQKVFYGGPLGNLNFWNLQDLRKENDIKVTKKYENITSIAITKDYSTVLVGSEDGYINFYEGNSFKHLFTRYVSGLNEGRFPYEVAVSPDGKYYAVDIAKRAPYIYFQEIEVKKTSDPYEKIYSRLTSDKARHLAFSADNEFLYSTQDGTVDVYTESLLGKPGHPLKGSHKGIVFALAASLNGKYLVSGDSDGTLIIWDLTTSAIGKILEGVHTDYIYHVAFSPNSKMVASGSRDQKIVVWDIETGKPIRAFGNDIGIVSSLAFSPDNKFVISSSGDNTLRIWNIETGLCTAFLTTSLNQWIVFNSDGYWDASPGGGNLVGMVKGMEAWNIDQFAVKNNRPDLILQGLGSTNQALIAHYKGQYLKRLRKLGLSETDLQNTENVPLTSISDVSTIGSSATIKATFNGNGVPLKRFNIYVNDVPIYGSYGKELMGNEQSVTENLALCSGQNKIEVSCINGNGIESYRDLAYANCNENPSRNLYLLAFGVSKYKNPAYNLAYAAKDASDLSSTIETLKGKGFENVYTKVLTNEQVTPEAIKSAKDFVKNAKPDDTFILFIAGHGMHDTDPEATYYYLTYNADIKNLKTTAADFETIEDLLQGIPPRNKLFLMDACESGEIDEETYETLSGSQTLTGLGIASRGFKSTAPVIASGAKQSTTKRPYLYQKDRYIYNDLVRRSGAIVFSSSKGGELSYERSDIENGLFTEYIMKALTTTEADKDGNGTVSTDELRQYVSEQVAKASGDLQHPTVDRDNLYQKFGFKIKNSYD